MRNYKLAINVLPPEGDSIINQYMARLGTELSTYDNIKFNTNKDGYNINYPMNVFENIDPSVLADNLLKIIKANFTNVGTVTVTIQCYNSDTAFSKIGGMNIIALDEYLEDIQESPMLYEESDTVDLLLRAWDDDENEFDFTNIDYDEDEDEEDDEDVEGIGEYLKRFGFENEDDDEDDENSNPFGSSYTRDKRNRSSGKKSSKTIKPKNTSIVFRKCKNPKKVTKRHGILTYSKSKHMEQDRKVIKNIIKEFIPGDEKWIKSFRNDLTDRWIKAFCISKKKLNRKIKKYDNKRKKEMRNKLPSYGLRAASTAMTIGSILSTAAKVNNRWNDPRR